MKWDANLEHQKSKQAPGYESVDNDTLEVGPHAPAASPIQSPPAGPGGKRRNVVGLFSLPVSQTRQPCALPPAPNPCDTLASGCDGALCLPTRMRCHVGPDIVHRPVALPPLCSTDVVHCCGAIMCHGVQASVPSFGRACMDHMAVQGCAGCQGCCAGHGGPSSVAAP